MELYCDRKKDDLAKNAPVYLLCCSTAYIIGPIIWLIFPDSVITSLAINKFILLFLQLMKYFVLGKEEKSCLIVIHISFPGHSTVTLHISVSFLNPEVAFLICKSYYLQDSLRFKSSS